MSNIFTLDAVEKEIACCRVKRSAAHGFGKNGFGRREIAALMRTLKRRAESTGKDGMIEINYLLSELKRVVGDDMIVDQFSHQIFSSSVSANGSSSNLDAAAFSCKFVSMTMIEQELNWLFHSPSLEKFQTSLKAEFMDRLGLKVPVRIHSNQGAHKVAARALPQPSKIITRNGWLQVEGHCTISKDQVETLPRFSPEEEDEIVSSFPEKVHSSEPISTTDEFKRVEVVARAVQSRRIKANDLEQSLAELIPQLDMLSTAVSPQAKRTNLWAREGARALTSSISTDPKSPVEISRAASVSGEIVAGASPHRHADNVVPRPPSDELDLAAALIDGRQYMHPTVGVRFLGDGESEADTDGRGDLGALNIAVEGEMAERTAFDLCSWAEKWLSDLLEVSIEGSEGDLEAVKHRFRQGLKDAEFWAEDVAAAEAEAADAEFENLEFRSQHLLLLYESLCDRRAGRSSVRRGPVPSLSEILKRLLLALAASGPVRECRYVDYKHDRESERHQSFAALLSALHSFLNRRCEPMPSDHGIVGKKSGHVSLASGGSFAHRRTGATPRSRCSCCIRDVI